MKLIPLILSSILVFALPAQADYKVAVAGPHTGAYAAFGEQLWRGASFAAEEINRFGGINGRRIEVVKADDACEPKQAVAVANRMVDIERVDAVLGHFCSSSSIPASNIYDEAGLLMVTPASTNPLVTDRGLPGVFRVCGRDDQQGIVAANYIVDSLKAQRVAVIHDKDTYGKGLADATKMQLNQRGIQEVLYEGLTRGEKDFNALVTKIRSLNVDVVYFGGLHNEAGPFVRQMREQGSDAAFVSGDGIISEDFIKAAGGIQFVQNVFMTFGADPRKIDAGQRVVDEFRSRDYEPEGYTLYSYAGMQVIAAALRAGEGSNDAQRLGNWLKRNTVNSVMGPKEFDQKGDLKVSDYVIYEWLPDGSYQQTL